MDTPSSFEILKQLAIRDRVYKEGDTEVTLQKKLKGRRHQGMQTRYLFDKNESSKNLPPRPDEFASISICAIRYTYGHWADTQARGFCIDATIKNWNWFSTQDKAVLRRDNEEAVSSTAKLIECEFYAVPPASYKEWVEFDRWLKDPEQQIVYPPKDQVYGLGLLTVYALRYCVGRMTYMPGLITDATKKNWHLLNRVDRQTIQQDTIAAIATRYLGMACDRETWLSFNEWVTDKMK